MKKSLTILASILFTAVFTFSIGQSSVNSIQPQKVFVSSGTAGDEIRPKEVLHDPIKLLGIWADEPVPLSVYTEEEIAIQKDINQQLGKQYAYTYRHIPDDELYDDNNENLPVELRNIDNEPITPYTWKVVQLRMTEADGTILNAQLRRPNWWIKHHGADRIGNMVRLSIHEMAIEGMAEVINIGANQIDTRVKSFDDDGNYTFRPITGWFERVSADTWDYTFSNGEVIGSTSNHRFFSEDRQDYVAIGEIKIGERIKVNSEQTAQLVSKAKRATEGEKVYNLEIYRDHNFHVGEEGLLVHNAYAVLQDFIAMSKKDKLDFIKEMWGETYYLAVFGSRKFMQSLIGHYKFTVAKGWTETGEFFPTIDFHSVSKKMGVSIKTTKVENVQDFLAQGHVQTNIDKLILGRQAGQFVQPGQPPLIVEKVQLSIFVPKENYSQSMVNQWKNAISSYVQQNYPGETLWVDIDFIEKHLN